MKEHTISVKIEIVEVNKKEVPGVLNRIVEIIQDKDRSRGINQWLK